MKTKIIVFISGLNNPDVNVCEFSNYCDLIAPEDLLIQEIPQHKQKGWYRKFEKKKENNGNYFKNK